jgi:DeoR/GlpR family transcriptional regulator of sugar metabolism
MVARAGGASVSDPAAEREASDMRIRRDLAALAEKRLVLGVPDGRAAGPRGRAHGPAEGVLRQIG